MNLLALDISTVTGWCVGDLHEGEPHAGSHKFEKSGAAIGPLLLAYDGWLTALLDRFEPTVIVMEEPMATQAGKTPAATAYKLQTMAGLTEYIAARDKLAIRQVHLLTWRAALCPGKGNIGKFKAQEKGIVYPPIQACWDRGWDPVDDNEADARGIWLYAGSHMARRQMSRFDPINRVGLLAA